MKKERKGIFSFYPLGERPPLGATPLGERRTRKCGEMGRRGKLENKRNSGISCVGEGSYKTAFLRKTSLTTLNLYIYIYVYVYIYIYDIKD